MLASGVDEAVVERAAEAAYVAVMESSGGGLKFEPWVSLSPYWKRIYRVQARAVLDVIGGAQ